MHDVVAAAVSAAEKNLHSADDWETSRTSDFKADPNSSCEFGDYRVIYEFDAGQSRIYLHYVGHRRQIYKRPYS